MIAALLLLAQATPAAPASPPQPERFSILVDPCANASNDGGNDVVVCGKSDSLQPRLPMPQFRGVPDHAVPSNPDMKASVALDGPGIGNECGAYLEDCPGLGNQINPAALVVGAVNAVGNAFKKRKYKDQGEPIPMEDGPVDTRGKLLP